MKEIILTKGYVALVDDEDYERVSRLRWSIAPRPLTDGTCYVYAQRTVLKGGKESTIKMHRFILEIEEGVQIDHIDGNTLNNQKENLRIASRSQNQGNRRPNKIHNGKKVSSKHKGVHLDKNSGKFRAQVYKNNKRINLGLFHDEVKAARAYDEAARAVFGEFAKLNFP